MRELPIALFPTAAQYGLSEGMVADMFQLDVRDVRMQNILTREILISRAFLLYGLDHDRAPRAFAYADWLNELSAAIMGHWSKLLTHSERRERRHVQFVIRVLKKRYNLQPHRTDLNV